LPLGVDLLIPPAVRLLSEMVRRFCVSAPHSRQRDNALAAPVAAG